MKRKLLSALLAVSIIASLFTFYSFTASADASEFTQDDAVDWIKARADEHWWEDVDNAYGCQCVDLIKKYYTYLVGHGSKGNAYEYVNNALPDNWYRTNTPTPGDIVVWGSNSYVGNANGGGYSTGKNGHIGLVYNISGNTLYTVETNVGSGKGGSDAYAQYRQRTVSSATIFIHPNLAEPHDSTAYCSSATVISGSTSAKFTVSLSKEVIATGGTISIMLPDGITVSDGRWLYPGPDIDDTGDRATNIAGFDHTKGLGAFIYDSYKYRISGNILEFTVSIPANYPIGKYDISTTVRINGPIKALDIGNKSGVLTIDKKPDEIFNGKCGDNLNWQFNKTTGVFTINGTGEMWTGEDADWEWENHKDYINSVKISNGVTSIGESAFYRCSDLTSVTIPDSVMSIGDYAFGYTGLTSVTIGNGVTIIGEGVFSHCDRLENITVSNDNSVYKSDKNCIIEKSTNKLILGCKNSIIPSYITSIGESAFIGCTKLTSVTIPNGVTDIGDWAFDECIGLTSVTIPNSVTSIGESTFCGCIKLASVTIGSSVRNIDNFAFYRCSGLTSITIPSSVASISNYAFGYTGLTSVTIPNSVTSIGKGAFCGCIKLASVTIGSSVTSIGFWAFDGCTGLTSITIPDSVTYIGDYAFEDCTGLTSITIPDSVTYIGDYAFEDCTGLTSITIPDNVTNIESGLFSGCTGLMSVTIPDSVTSICTDAFEDCEQLEYNFYDNAYYLGNENNPYVALITTDDDIPTCIMNSDTRIIAAYAFCLSKLTLKSVEIPDGVTHIGEGAFSFCSKLKSVTIPNSVTKIGINAFTGCNELTSVTISNSVTDIPSCAFSGCELISVSIPNSVTSIGEAAFYGCTELASVTIPSSVTRIGESAFKGCDKLSYNSYDNAYYLGNNDNPYFALVEAKNADITDCTINNNTKLICGGAFSGCTELTSVTIGNGVTSIGDAAFFGCSGLTSITIPDSVTYIGYHAFEDCTGLTSVTIGNSVTNIESGTFSNCTGLTSITIPNSVTNIESETFSGCTGLTSVTIPNSVISIGHEAFYNCSELVSIVIPHSVISIAGEDEYLFSAFYDCENLEKIYYLGAEADWKKIDGYDNVDNDIVIFHTEHTFDDDLDTTCDICGYVRIIETSGDGWDYDDGKMTFDGEITAGKWEEFAGKVTEITMGKSVKEIGDDFFSHFDKLEKFIIMGNPTVDANALPDDPDIEICGWSNTNIQSACETKGVKFKSLEEFTIAGYQDGYKEENSFRAAAQMRYAEYYTAAGYDITAVGSDGYGHNFNRKISHEITTVYKSLTGRLENGSVGTVKTADEGCYLSAIGFTDLPAMGDNGAIIFTITPYVYNPYSGEKISLEPVEFKYTANGVKPYTSLKLNNGSSDGKEIAWSDFKD